MALYSTSAFTKNTLRMQTGVLPIYLFGSRDDHTVPFLFQISKLSLTSNVATATVQLISGGGGVGGGVPRPIPQVGAVMGVQGTTLTSGLFNVDPTTVTGVTLDANGAGTITYAKTHADVVEAANSGHLIVQPYEYPDLVIQGSASIPVAQTFTPDDADNSRCLFADAKWYGTLPSAAVVVLEAANVDEDGRYYVLKNTQGCAVGASVAASDSLATLSGSAVTQAGAQYSFIMGKFLRAKVLSMTGGDGTTGLVVTLFA